MPTQDHTDKQHDQTLKDSFPASDAPANSGITGAEQPDEAADGRSEEAVPTGLPNSDRYAAETVHHAEDHVPPSVKR